VFEGELSPSEVVYRNHDGPLDFAIFMQKAKKAGVQPEILLEAQMVEAVLSRDPRSIAPLLPRAKKRAENFQDAPTVIGQESFLSILHFFQAILAREAGDKEAVKKHMCEAFLVCPETGDALGAILMEWRSTPAQPVVLDLDRAVPVAGGGNSTLKR